VYDGARNGVPSRSKWLHGRNPSRCFSIAAWGAVMHIENIFNNLPKCTTYSSEGEVRVAASTHTALETRKRGGVKREEKHYTLHDTAKLHYFDGTRTSLPRSLCLGQPCFRRCAALHASVLPKLPESGATHICGLRVSTAHGKLTSGGIYECTMCKINRSHIN